MGPLRLIYLPSADVDADVRFHVEKLGGELRWFLDRHGARVAAVRHGGGPDLVFASHLAGQAVLLFEGRDPPNWIEAHEVATPPGPAWLFHDPGQRKLGVLHLLRPEAAEEAWVDPTNPSAVHPDWIITGAARHL